MKHVIVGTAGHIDHGKSALVRALTGTDPDRLKEEKARGITIDLGFAHDRHDDVTLAFVDVPGHERFVRNMLAGASGIDCVVLVIAADESVMPQTREHFDICCLLGVRAGVVALTKCDLADRETTELVTLETRELVAGSFLDGAPIIPVSAVTGEGLETLRAALRVLGATLAVRSTEGAARLPIDRAFTVKGFGTVVTGTQVSGRIHVERELEMLPAGRPVKVRGLQVHGERCDESLAGQRVAVNLAGVEVGNLRRGDTVVDPGRFRATRRLDATVSLLPTARRLKHGARVRFHQGTTEVMARVALAGLAVEGSDTDEGPALAGLEPGGAAYTRVHLERPAALTRGDRFVLRTYSPAVTIGGGTVLDPAPPRRRLRSSAGVRRLGRLAAAGVVEAVMVMVEEADEQGLPTDELSTRLGLAPSAATATVDTVVGKGDVVVVGDRLVAAAACDRLKSRLIDAVTVHHGTHPLDEGLPREEARERIGRHAAPAVFEAAVDDLVMAGTVVATGSLALTSHRISLSTEEQAIHDRIAASTRDAGLQGPDLKQLVDIVKAPPATVERMVKLLVRGGTLVRLGSLVVDAETLGALEAEVRGLKEREDGGDPPRIDVKTFKDRYGISRKYAIPLLEHLDRSRITKRVGNTRIVI